MRNLSHELHPAALEYGSLPVALNARCKEFSEVTAVKIMFEASGSFEDVPSPIELCIYRVAQEALRNVARHAATDSATVHLTRSSSSVILSVCDSGVGFCLDQARSSGGLGLISIKERVRLVRGSVHVLSEPNRGTTLTVEVPTSATVSEDHEFLAH
jgi:signal transduction histidine kinase